MKNLKAYLSENPKKYVIFDFDETLFTLDLPWEKYYPVISEKLHKLDPTYPAESDNTALENGVTQKIGKRAAEVRWRYSKQFEKDNLRGVTELSDLTNFIRDNHAKYIFYLWTSNMRETVQPILQKNGLLRYFKQLVTKGDVLLMKPNPEGFTVIFDPQTQTKNEFLMVGDSEHDQQAAKAAGIDWWMRT
jgi:HAD superfamily hydrolase (TIGR01549 family)